MKDEASGSPGSPGSPGALVSLGERIEVLATEPHLVRSLGARLAGPLLRLVRWEPDFKVKAIAALLDALRRTHERRANKRSAPIRREDPAGPDGPTFGDLADAAVEELDANVTGAERACVVNGRVPTARAAWLRRLYEVVTRAVTAVEDAGDTEKRRIAAAVDPVMLLPPLALAPPPPGSPPPPSPSPRRRRRHRRPSPPSTSPPPSSPPSSPPPPSPRASPPGEAVPGEEPPAAAVPDERLIELELAAIDHLLDASRAEADFLGRRRRLLEAARQLLLETSAALPLETAGVEARRAHIAEQIVRLNRFEAAGIAPDVGLLHQAKTALSRGERQKLYAALGALDEVALSRGDGASLTRTSAAVRVMTPDLDRFDERARRTSLERSSKEVLGNAVIETVRRGYEAGREDLARAYADMAPKDREKQKAVIDYFASGSEIATLSAALAVDGCFEVGGVLSPVRVEELETRLRAVSYPTPDLLLMPAQDITDVPGAVIDDPRRILLSLAEGRLLTRKFIEVEAVTRRRTELVGEARIYLLDGSESMVVERDGRDVSARARMRDAILLAELATLHRRFAEKGRRVRVVLFFRYFTVVLWPTTRVDSEDSALKAMVEVIRTPRRGGTDIEGALVASFQQVREAREADPALARAQIVLVTDGNAEVNEEAIRVEREKAGDLPIAVSVIALGEENASLRALVARQRARGERAFYHFISDDALRSIVDRGADRGPAIHLDALISGDRDRSAADLGTELTAQLGELLDELGELGRKRHIEAMEGVDADAQALVEVGLPADAVPERERARRELLDRDRRALEARFLRWFPAPPIPAPGAQGKPSVEAAPDAPVADAPMPGTPMPGTSERDNLDAVTVVLATVSEVVGEVGGSPLQRRADAIEILERLLPDARLSPARYLAVLHAYPGATARALQAVHRAVSPPSGA